ncbi:hypothetical protein CK203_094806 [Vitis vinifera]|uniref:Uncharacterized protein n=1 Tax=Vitis vinifera TaxID=29760 RepID=A0A438CZD3_VITVI|nr:hypothetical protein CK203_094806 [Vitis vinifera]
MSHILLKSCTLALASVRITRPMSRATSSSKPLLPALQSKTSAHEESPNGVSGSEVRVFVRKKRVKMAAETPEKEIKAEPQQQKVRIFTFIYCMMGNAIAGRGCKMEGNHFLKCLPLLTSVMVQGEGVSRMRRPP